MARSAGAGSHRWMAEGGLTLALLSLAWLALDDITTGHEPELATEWIVVMATAAWMAALARRHLGGGRLRRSREGGR